MDFEKLLASLKLSPKHFLALSLATCVLLFAPKNILSAIALDVIVSKYKPWIGMVFLLSTALLLSYAFFEVGPWLKEKYQQLIFIKRGKKRLASLTPNEKNILRRYISQNNRTQYLHIEDGVVSGLSSSGIIYRSSTVGDFDQGWAHNIQPWAWTYLQEHPDILFTKKELRELKLSKRGG